MLILGIMCIKIRFVFYLC